MVVMLCDPWIDVWKLADFYQQLLSFVSLMRITRHFSFPVGKEDSLVSMAEGASLGWSWHQFNEWSLLVLPLRLGVSFLN